MSLVSPASAAESLFPATPAQERLWHIGQDHGDHLSKHIAVQWELRGRFADANVEAAFQTVLNRHEILRSGLVERDGRLWQKVTAEVAFHLGSIDLRNIAPEACDTRIRAIAEELAGKPFDMAAPGQLRACLVRFAPERAMLLIATHYGVFDGYSIRILGREIGTLIAAFETATPPDLPDLALQFGDYAQWREACADAPAMAETRAHWQARLRDSPYFALPTDRPRGPDVNRRGATLKLPMAAGFRADLERAAKAQATSPFAFGAGVMAAALHAVTGQARVGFTTCVAGREEVELENLIGSFVNPVVLQFDCAGASVGTLITAARRIVAEALAHGDYPFDQLAADLGQDDPTKTPFVAPFFSLQPVFVEEQDYGPLRIVSVPSHTPQVTHDLAVQVIGRASGWHMIIDYDSGLFDEATVRRFAVLLQETFALAFDHPEAAVGRVALITPAAAARLSSTQSRLAVIWGDILTKAPQGPADDFFEHGGHSMAALRMLARVEADLGARIALADFFDDPTLAGLSAKIDSALGTGPKAPEAWQVIPLRPSSEGPLVVSVNQPFLYHGLARALPAGVEVINLHIRDRAALEGGLAALIDSGADLIAARAKGRRVQLIGHCVDGTLALLIARRLAEAGAMPDLVSMIDAWAPGANGGLSPLGKRLRRWGLRARRWGQHLGQLARRQIGWTEFLSRNKITRPLLVAYGRMAPETEAEREEWAVNARLVGLVRDLPHVSYPGPVALFRTGGQHPDARPRLFGWQALAADTPVFDLPGWHEHSVKTHGVQRLAAILGSRLTRSPT